MNSQLKMLSLRHLHNLLYNRRSAGPKEFDFLAEERMAKSSDQLDEGLNSNNRILRRDASTYSDNVFRNERPKSDHYDTEYTGCLSPSHFLRSLSQNLWGPESGPSQQ